MDYVATLVAGSGQEVDPALLSAIAGVLQSAGVADVRQTWLEQSVAADVFFSGSDQGNLLRKFLAEHPIDVIVQTVQNRCKKLLVADMESTIIEQEMLDELAQTIGLRDKVAAITARAMNGELDFAAALKERVALLRGLPACVLDDVARRITLMPGAKKLLHGMKTAGASAWLVSGGFTCFAKPIGEALGFDRIFANELVVENNTITGEVTQPYLDKERKKTLLQQACRELGISLAETAAIGDGANDIPMLNACNEQGGLGVAFHAKPNVRTAVPHHINHGDLRVLLYAQSLL